MAKDESMRNLAPETQSPDLYPQWKPSRLPELATKGLPFSATFILPGSGNILDARASCAENARPFGFHFWRQHTINNRPVIDLTMGYYDPYTQVYTIPLQ